MEKKRKVQLYVIVLLIIGLSLFLLYEVGYSIYKYKSAVDMSHKIKEEFYDIYENEEMQVILFASPTCIWCKKFVPILDEISKEENFTYNYIDVGKLLNKDLNEIYEKIKLKKGGTPNLVIIKDKKLVANQLGAFEKDETVEFLKNNGVIKGEIEDGESISTNS